VLAVALWAAPSIASAETVPLPANAASSQAHGLDASACASAGNCVAGGFYTDGSNRQQGLLLSETNGAWTASELTFAFSSLQHPAPEIDPQVTSVACASAGNCVAAGYALDVADDPQGFVVSEGGGIWGRAIGTTGPAPASLDAPLGALPEVSCVPNSDCYAIFDTWTGTGLENLVYANTNGSWTLTHVPSPSGGSGPELTSISCPPGGQCAVVGVYEDTSSHVQGLVSTLGSLTATAINASTVPNLAAAFEVVPHSSPWVRTSTHRVTTTGCC
jgi:hypothetical protein